MADSFIGEIRMFGGIFAPMDWAFCDGQSLPIAQYDVLYSLIGTTYGGDGVANFNLPDLRGRLPMHQGNGYAIGQMGGQETVTLQANQVAVHTHTVRAQSGAGDKDSPASNVWAAAPSGRYSTATPALAMKASSVGNAGGGLAHDNMMPYLVVNFIISLSGDYPQRD